MVIFSLIKDFESADDKLYFYCKKVIELCKCLRRGKISLREWSENLVLLNALFFPIPDDKKLDEAQKRKLDDVVIEALKTICDVQQ